MLLNPEDVKSLELKISALEQLTSAELKIIICSHAWFGIRQKARRLFKKHKLNQTTERNGVLILLVEKDRELLIYGDEGINQKVGDDFWTDTHQSMITLFKQGEFCAGLNTGLHLITDSLTSHFPPSADAINEVSNDIIFEK